MRRLWFRLLYFRLKELVGEIIIWRYLAALADVCTRGLLSCDFKYTVTPQFHISITDFKLKGLLRLTLANKGKKTERAHDSSQVKRVVVRSIRYMPNDHSSAL